MIIIGRDDCPDCKHYTAWFDCCNLITNGLPCKPEKIEPVLHPLTKEEEELQNRLENYYSELPIYD